MSLDGIERHLSKGYIPKLICSPADLLFIFGYNGADSHPIVARRIVRAKEKGATLITVDPRVTETARISDMHLPIKGGTNMILVNAFGNVLINKIYMMKNS